MTTEKRHMYSSTINNVSVGDVIVEQDINYYSSKNQSVTRSIIRFIEDYQRRFTNKIIYDGCVISGTTTVDISAGNLVIGGRWITIDATSLSLTSVSDGTYDVVVSINGVTESEIRDPSSGESVTITLETDPFTDTDFTYVLGKVVVASNNISSYINRGARTVRTKYIAPYNDESELSILTGTAPVRTNAVDFKSSEIDVYLPTVFSSGVSAHQFSVSGSVLSDVEFGYLTGLDQSLATTDDVAFNTVDINVASGTQPLTITSRTKVTNLNADLLDGQHAPAGDIVGTTDTQTLSNKILSIPTISNFTSGTHNHKDASGGGTIDINSATTGTLAIGQGGTGNTSYTNRGVIVYNGTNYDELGLDAGKIVVGAGLSSNPQSKTMTVALTGDVSGSSTLASTGTVTVSTVVANDSHTHDTRYYTETEIDSKELSNKNGKLWVSPELAIADNYTCSYDAIGWAYINNSSIQANIIVPIPLDRSKSINGTTRYLKILSVVVYMYQYNLDNYDGLYLKSINSSYTQLTTVASNIDTSLTGYFTKTITVNSTLSSSYVGFKLLINVNNDDGAGKVKFRGMEVEYEYV